jgi:hypothetical protein
MTEEWRDLPLRTVLETAGEYAAARRAGAEVAVSGESAWREVMRRIELLAHRLAFPLDADEVTQLVLVRLQEPERIASVLRSNNTTAYLFQLIRNVARELERARNAEARRLVGLAVQARVVPEPGTAESLLDQAGSLKRALARLSPGDRALLGLHRIKRRESAHDDHRPEENAEPAPGELGQAKWELGSVRRALSLRCPR